MRMIDGTLYCNDGDWVESLCALVEHEDGRLAILHWHDVVAATGSKQTATGMRPPVTAWAVTDGR
jgi:hypothetical protein